MSQNIPEKQVPIADDLIWGAASIAAELGVPLQRVYYLIRTNRIPIAKIGTKTIVASRRQLRRALTPAISVISP
jgi:hypothetical protein